ncbi:hypothetical protein [Mycobacterium sp. NPDC050853]|uniref:DUF7214 domain-containing protein n=1 Tax=Mycobacterium sp. NPDC050853 TaxID=3155160 RepID=UPI0033E41676
MMQLVTKTGVDGLREIRAVDEIGTLAMAIEHHDARREGETYWHLAVVYIAQNMPDPGPPYPVLNTIEDAQAWLEFVGDLLNRARELAKRDIEALAVSG